MKKDPPWLRGLLPSFMDGKPTGSQWRLVFWFARRRDHYNREVGMPHPQLPDWFHRKWYERHRHSVLNEELNYLVQELPWQSSVVVESLGQR